MHPIRPSGNRHIRPPIHQQLRRPTLLVKHVDDRPRQFHQLAGSQSLLPQLHKIHAQLCPSHGIGK